MKQSIISVGVALIFMAGVCVSPAMAQCRTQTILLEKEEYSGQPEIVPEICLSLALDGPIVPDPDADPADGPDEGKVQDVYTVGEQIKFRITGGNVGDKPIITSYQFSKQIFHLLLQITDPDGVAVAADYWANLPRVKDPGPPEVKYVGTSTEPLQVEQIKVLGGVSDRWVVNVGPFNVHDFYTLPKLGEYTATFEVSIWTAPEDVQIISGNKPGVNYIRSGAITFSDDLQSNPVVFTIAAMRGDFNSDGCVDRADYYIMMADIRGPAPHDIQFDLNEDGAVNRADARTLVGLFTNRRGAPCN
jgi:hypothetical protein